MTSTLWAFSNKNTEYSLVEETRSIKPGYNLDESSTSAAKDSSLEFISEDKKIFLRVPTGYYHCVHDFAGLVFHLNDIYPGIVFMFDTSEIKMNKLAKKASDFCFKLFDIYKINYTLIDLYNIKEFNANNFYVSKFKPLDHDGSRIMFNKCLPFIKDLSVTPYRKAYLSRRNIQTDNRKPSDMNVFKNFSRQTFQRVDNEELVEKFFEECGFEIIFPEDFNTLEDQINYFYEVKTLVSITGAGLANSMFMQPEGTVIEITTPMITQSFDQEFNVKHYLESAHHHYTGLSLKKNHLHIGIPNISVNANKLLSDIKSNSGIMAVLLDD